jgi:hypothetical protein
MKNMSCFLPYLARILFEGGKLPRRRAVRLKREPCLIEANADHGDILPICEFQGSIDQAMELIQGRGVVHVFPLWVNGQDSGNFPAWR